MVSEEKSIHKTRDHRIVNFRYINKETSQEFCKLFAAACVCGVAANVVSERAPPGDDITMRV